jgi:hypothetical protein
VVVVYDTDELELLALEALAAAELAGAAATEPELATFEDMRYAPSRP